MIPCIFLKKSLNKFYLNPVILFVLFFIWPAIALPQQRKTRQDQLLTLPSQTIRLDSLSSMLARKTGFVLSFNAGMISPGTRITFPGTAVKLNALLCYLHAYYRLAHKMIGNHIILSNDTSSCKKVRITEKTHKDCLSREKPGTRDQHKTVALPLEKAIKPLHINAGAPLRNLSPSLPEELGKMPVRQDHILKINAAEPALHAEGKMIRLAGKPGIAEKEKGVNPTRSGKGNDRFYASAGLTASEVLYLNPQVKIGLPWLFGLAAWETNFKTSGFFYGLGTSFKLSDHWDFQLSASTGSLSKDFRWPAPASDTMGRIKTRLTRIDILGEIHLSRRWVVQFGPVLNFMKSKYSLKDSAIVNSFPSGDVHKDMYILNPPYTLHNSYNEKTGSGKKRWVGFRIGLFYTLW